LVILLVGVGIVHINRQHATTGRLLASRLVNVTACCKVSFLMRHILPREN